MLPGITGIGGLTNFQDPFVSYSSNTANGFSTVAVNKPTGTTSGDILVAVMMASNASGITWTGDTSWTEIYDEGDSARPSLRVAYLVAGGSEPSSYTFTASTATGLLAQIMCFRGYGYDTIGSNVVLGGNGSLVITGLTSAGGILIGCAASASGASTPTQSTPTGMTLVGTTTLSSAHAITSWYQFVAAGATGTRTTTVAGTPTNSNGILVGLK